jgi:PadR family transcriptional regulator
LRRDGLVTTAWHDSPNGPPRRHYELTRDGHQALELFTAEWDRFTNAVLGRRHQLVDPARG